MAKACTPCEREGLRGRNNACYPNEAAGRTLINRTAKQKVTETHGDLTAFVFAKGMKPKGKPKLT